LYPECNFCQQKGTQPVVAGTKYGLVAENWDSTGVNILLVETVQNTEEQELDTA
jgi:hypothetical protein